MKISSCSARRNRVHGVLKAVSSHTKCTHALVGNGLQTTAGEWRCLVGTQVARRSRPFSPLFSVAPVVAVLLARRLQCVQPHATPLGKGTGSMEKANATAPPDSASSAWLMIKRPQLEAQGLGAHPSSHVRVSGLAAWDSRIFHVPISMFPASLSDLCI